MEEDYDDDKVNALQILRHVLKRSAVKQFQWVSFKLYGCFRLLSCELQGGVMWGIFEFGRLASLQ
jgi:hypothetical protein